MQSFAGCVTTMKSSLLNHEPCEAFSFGVSSFPLRWNEFMGGWWEHALSKHWPMSRVEGTLRPSGTVVGPLDYTNYTEGHGTSFQPSDRDEDCPPTPMYTPQTEWSLHSTLIRTSNTMSVFMPSVREALPSLTPRGSLYGNLDTGEPF
jgi:hypothetical protein